MARKGAWSDGSDGSGHAAVFAGEEELGVAARIPGRMERKDHGRRSGGEVWRGVLMDASGGTGGTG
jgi:hypothetical protein